MLLNAGANVALQDAGGRTPLHLAAASGSVAVVRACLDGTKERRTIVRAMKIRDTGGLTALDMCPTRRVKRAFWPRNLRGVEKDISPPPSPAYTPKMKKGTVFAVAEV